MNERSLYNSPTASGSYFAGTCVLTVPVLFLCYLTCPHYEPLAMLPLYSIEWIVTVCVFYKLCPWLREKGVAIAAILFVICFAVAAIKVGDHRAEYNTSWGWSDDWFYVQCADYLSNSLRSSNWNVFTSWEDLIGNKVHWTLAGWPFCLGLVSSIFLEDRAPLEAIHAVALSLNAVFLAITLAIMFHIMRDTAKRFPWLFFLCFLLLAGSPLVYVGESRKESMLQLTLMVMFFIGVQDYRNFSFRLIILLTLATLALATLRPAYLIIPCAILFFHLARKFKLDTFKASALGLLVIAVSYPVLITLEIREYSVGEMLNRGICEGLQTDQGLGMRIYGFPLVGPYVFYLLAPLPINFLRVASTPLSYVIISLGNIFYVLSFLFVAHRLIVRKHVIWRGLFPAAAAMFVFLFLCAVFAADDPRYKQPTNFYLAIMLFSAWVDVKQFALSCRRALQSAARFPGIRRRSGISTTLVSTERMLESNISE